MGILSSIGKFIIGGTRNSEKIIDSGFRAIDKAVLTPQEKVEAQKELITDLHNISVEHEKLNTGSAVNRRRIAWSINLSTLLTFFYCIILKSFGNNDLLVDEIVALSETFKIGWAFVGVNTYYFGTHIAKAMRGDKK